VNFLITALTHPKSFVKKEEAFNYGTFSVNEIRYLINEKKLELGAVT
jgi:hypothetical protein